MVGKGGTYGMRQRASRSELEACHEACDADDAGWVVAQTERVEQMKLTVNEIMLPGERVVHRAIALTLISRRRVSVAISLAVTSGNAPARV